MRIYLLALLPVLTLAQNGEEAVENAENFRRLYGIASKIMELSGNIMNGNGGSDQEIRPRFQGMLANAKFAQPTTTTTQAPSGFKSILDTFLGTGGSSGSAGGGAPADEYENLPPPPTPRPRPRQNLFGQMFGGGVGGGQAVDSRLMPTPPPTTTTTTTEATPVQRIMNLFVPQPERPQPEQSSSKGRINFLEMFGLAKPTTTTTAAPPLRALFAPDKPYSGTAEDFDGIMNALLRTNAKPARQEPSSILSQFFGGRK
ncbi:Protein CBG16726 [Caenorhabditis briggsae]|uniref:Protein CBG16726 n=1 Tax=Caenorhabditis briggsae TaxID=6238 RepID=A8XPP6_CAEBR|nr:Protein CBG16726 [Caenorhabditis briggsae]CAP34622.2 Protein CBG16726 [Caenorhabditis briggsae]